MKLFLGLLLLVTACADEPQVWTSRDGKTFTGDFLATRPGKVFVRDKQKKVFAIPMAKLSDACLAEACYLQEKLGEWARGQVDRKAMDESTANAVLMLEPLAFAGKTFLMVARVREIETGTKVKPVKGPKVQFTTEGGVECQADFKEWGELTVIPAGVYTNVPPGEPPNPRNSTELLIPLSHVPVQVKIIKGKIVGGFLAKPLDLKTAREADGKALEYEREIMRQRIAVMEEQLRTGVSLASHVTIQDAAGKPIVIAEHRFTPEEVETMKMELGWLKAKINPNERLIDAE